MSKIRTEHVCRRCGTRQDLITCGDCKTTVCVVCNDRCRRCEKPLCEKHFERSEGRGGICDECLKVRRIYLEEGQRVFESEKTLASESGQGELALIFKRARTILKDLERWDARLEGRREELEARPDRRVEDLTRQIKELQEMEVALHAARHAAEEATAAKSRFVAQVSHEIRTPMNAVVAMADLLSETKLDAQQKKYLGAVRRSGEHLVRIVGDILDHSKLEAGRLSIESIAFDLEEACAGVVEILAVRGQEKHVPLVFRYSPDAARMVIGDPARIRQVLMNLIGNAIKFTHAGNVVLFVEQLGYAQDRAVMRITVLDTGIGIPRDKYPAIFEQFDQGGASVYREYGGTGLGLAITNQLVRLMGGHVGLTSSEGKGSRFRVTLAMQLAEQSTGGSEVPPILAGKRVLVADPSKTSAEFLAAFAQSLGAEVMMVVDRSNVMEQLLVAKEQQNPFHSIWLHHMPPYLDAAALGGAIRVSELLPRTLLACFSSAGTEERPDLYEELGFSAYFHGPCTRRAMREALQEAIDAFDETPSAPMTALSSAWRLADSGSGERSPDALGRSYRVLVVDDRPVNQEVAAAIFDSLGCELTLAADGEQAVQYCLTGQFEIVFMDCQMPVMDGYEATRRIRRSDGPAAKLPIIAMTAEVADGYRERCLQAGMNDYIPKPATRQMIASAMRRWLDSPQVARPPEAHAQAAPIPPAGGGENGDDTVVDRSAALYSLGGKTQILQRITSVFLDSVPQEAKELGRAIQDGRLYDVERLAHSIKTASASLGGRRVSRLSAQLELAGHNQDAVTAKRIRPDFEEEFDALVRQLSQMDWSLGQAT